MAMIYPKLWPVRVIPDTFRKRPKHPRRQSPGSAKNSNWGGCFGDAGKACLNVDLEPRDGQGCAQKPPVPTRDCPGSRQRVPAVPRNLGIPRMRRTPRREAISAYNCAARPGGRPICVTLGCVPLLEMWRSPTRGPHFS